MENKEEILENLEKFGKKPLSQEERDKADAMIKSEFSDNENLLNRYEELLKAEEDFSDLKTLYDDSVKENMELKTMIKLINEKNKDDER